MTRPVPRDEGLVLLRRVDAVVARRGDRDRDPLAVLEDPQLLERLGAFQRRRRQLDVAREEVPPIDVEADVLERPRGGGFRGAVSEVRDRCTAEVQRPPGAVDDDLDDIRVRRVGR
jgi:hypothetical protein